MQKQDGEILTLGIDLGGTKVETSLVDVDGHIRASHISPTSHTKGPEGIIDDIVACVNGCLGKEEREARALGIGVAGQVDHEGVVYYCPNLKWRMVPLKKILEDKLKMPVVVVNDVRAAAMGEWRFGAGRGVNDMVVLFVGTGIGGGVVTGGKILQGCTNAGGELGHMTLAMDGRKCHCPNTGCLEAYAGGWAIAGRAQAAASANPDAGRRLVSLAGKLDNITAVTVGDAFREGDPLAIRLVNETGRYLAAGVVSIVNALNPCLVVLGGGVIEGLPELIGIVEKGVRSKALGLAVSKIKVVKASLGKNAGVIGAAAFAHNRVQEYQIGKQSE